MKIILLTAAMSYLLGSFPSAYIIARLFKGIDIRKHGSGNPGATNVFRVVGKTAGTLVFLMDMLKGFFAVYLAARLLNADVYLLLEAAIFAVAGHNWPVWLSFKGGKGVATSAGVVLALVPVSAIAGIAVFFITLLLTKYVSVSSIISSITAAVVTVLTASNPPVLKTVIPLLCLVIIIRHKNNIGRLIKGEEPRITK